MARHTSDQVVASKHGCSRQVLWDGMRKAKDGWTIKDIAWQTSMHIESVRDYLKCLQAGGFVAPVGEHRAFKPGKWRVIKRPLEAPRLRPDGKEVTQGRGRENMWRTMKRLHAGWTPRELKVAASTKDVLIAEEEARTYVRALEKAGYLRVTDKAKPGTMAKYAFIPTKDTGCKPPEIQRIKSVFDPNMQKVVWTTTEGRRNV